MTKGQNQTGPNAVVVDLGEQMKYFDRLTPELRELVNRLPTKEEVQAIWQIQCRYGAGALDMIEGVFDQEFPGWREPEAKGPHPGQSIRDRRISNKLRALR